MSYEDIIVSIIAVYLGCMATLFLILILIGAIMGIVIGTS